MSNQPIAWEEPYMVIKGRLDNYQVQILSKPENVFAWFVLDTTDGTCWSSGTCSTLKEAEEQVEHHIT